MTLRPTSALLIAPLAGVALLGCSSSSEVEQGQDGDAGVVETQATTAVDHLSTASIVETVPLDETIARRSAAVAAFTACAERYAMGDGFRDALRYDDTFIYAHTINGDRDIYHAPIGMAAVVSEEMCQILVFGEDADAIAEATPFALSSLTPEIIEMAKNAEGYEARFEDAIGRPYAAIVRHRLVPISRADVETDSPGTELKLMR